MLLTNPVKKFLEQKLKSKSNAERKGFEKCAIDLKRKDFAQKSGIPYSTVNRLLTKDYLNPNITTIYAIAKYFECSMDEVVGREISNNGNKKVVYNENLTEKEIYNNIRTCIKEYLKRNPMSPYKLSEQLGLSEHVIPDFIKNG